MCQKLHSDIIKSYFASSVIWQCVIRSLQFWWKERIENKTLLPSHLSSRLQLHFCILEAFIVQGRASSQDFRKVKLLPLFYKMGKGSLRREVGKEDWRGSQMVLGKNRYGSLIPPIWAYLYLCAPWKVLGVSPGKCTLEF